MYAILEVKTIAFQGSITSVTAQLILPPGASTPANVIGYGNEEIRAIRNKYRCENLNLNILHHHAMSGFTLVGIDPNPYMQNSHDLDVVHYYLAIPPGYIE